MRWGLVGWVGNRGLTYLMTAMLTGAVVLDLYTGPCVVVAISELALELQLL